MVVKYYPLYREMRVVTNRGPYFYKSPMTPKMAEGDRHPLETEVSAGPMASVPLKSDTRIFGDQRPKAAILKKVIGPNQTPDYF